MEAQAADSGRGEVSGSVLALLARVRLVAMTFMVMLCASFLVEDLTHRDAFTNRVKVVLSGAGLVLALVGGMAEWGSSRQRRILMADTAELEQRRKQDVEDLLRQRKRRHRIELVLEGSAFPQMIYQPILHLPSGRVAGYEALSRFAIGNPQSWFDEAAAVGLGVELEMKAVRRAMVEFERLPADVYLAVNCSPATLLSGELFECLSDGAGERIVLELTENVPVTHYEQVAEVMARLRAMGARVAIDDVGAGYASFQHVIRLRPDILKLDQCFAAFTEPESSDLFRALLAVGRTVGATVVAEGIENEATVRLARDAGVVFGQGWYLGRPQTMEAIVSGRTGIRS